MTDVPRDKNDLASVGRLVDRLKGAEAQVEANVARSAKTAAATERSATRVEKVEEGARRERVARERKYGGAPRGAAGGEGAQAAYRKYVESEERAARALDKRLAAEREENRLLRAAKQIEDARIAGYQRMAGVGAGARAKASPIAASPAATAASRVQAAVLREQAAQAERVAAASERVARSGQLALPPTGGTSNVPRGRLATRPVVGSQAPPVGGWQAFARAAAVSDARMAGLNETQTEAYTRAMAGDRAMRSEASGLAYHARALGLSSTAMRRHGALTTEFIEAAARGQVTFRELGYQVGTTIGKFAGWTIAATSVYAVVGALASLGRGAIDAASGVELVNRVTQKKLPGGNDELQKRFGDLSRKYNVPVEDTVQAVYGSAKAFGGDLPAALKGAEAALFGVKVGELSAADSTRYLTAIVNGFQLSAEQLPAVFDAINQAQNRFGGNTGQLIAGIAKAGGAFHLAAGQADDWRAAIGIIETGVKLTGASGENVGTALARSAANVLTPQGQKRLREAGLNPKQEYTHLLAQAFEEAHGASRERVQEIAKALVPAGGQFTRIFAPLLQNVELYNKVMKEISPEKAKGSAQKELAHALKQPDEQLKRLMLDLERLGVSLSRAGALDPLIGLIRGLDLMLNTANELIKVFDLIPAPLRHGLAIMLEIAGVMRLMRRFDLGGSLPAGRAGGVYEGFRGSLRRSPEALQRAQTIQGLGDERRFLDDLRHQTARQAALSSYQAERAGGRVDTLRRQGAHPELIARAQTDYETRLEDASRLEQDRADLAARTATVQRQAANFERRTLRGKQSVAQAAEAESILYRQPTLQRPVPGHPTRITPRPQVGGYTPPHDLPFKGDLGQFDQPGYIPPREHPIIMGPADADAPTGKFARAQRALETRTTAAAARARSLGAAGRPLARALELGSSALIGAGASIGAIGRGFQSFGKQIAASLGPLDVLIIGALALQQSYSYIKRKISDSDRQISSLTAPTADARGMQARARDELGQRSAMDLIQGAAADTINRLDPFGNPASSPDDRENDAARKALSEGKALQEAQSHGRLLPLSTIAAQYKGRASRATNDRESIQAIDKEIDAIRNGWALANGGPDAKRAAQEALRSAQTKRADLVAASGTLDQIAAAISGIRDVKSLQQFSGDTQARIGFGGLTNRNLARARGIQAQARELAASPGSGVDLAQTLQVIQETDDAVKSELDRNLEGALKYAPAGRQRGLRANYIQQLRAQLLEPTQNRIKDLQGSVTARQKEIDKLEQNISNDPAGQINRGFGRHTDSRGSARLTQLKARQQRDRTTLRNLRDQLRKPGQTVKEAQREQQRAQFEVDQALYDAQTNLQVAQTADPVQKARIQLRRSNARLAAIAKEYTKDSAEYVKALTDNAQLRDQAIQAELDRFQATQELATARASIGAREGTKLQRAISDAQNMVAKMQSYGNRIDPSKVLQAQTQVANAQAAYAEYIRQQSLMYSNAVAELGITEQDDPVQQARAKLTEANNALADALKHGGKGDIAQARVGVREANFAYHNAQLQSKEDDIDFEKEMGRISTQTAISRYQELLKLHGLTKRERRDIQSKIKQLQDSAESESQGFNLDLGNIRMPTAYDVHRAFGPIRAQAEEARRAAAGNGGTGGGFRDTYFPNASGTSPGQVSQLVQAPITVIVNDKNAVGAVTEALERALNSGVAANLRSAGVT